jgi:hypothetical protein
MSTMNKDMIITETLNDLSVAVRQLAHQVQHQDSFLQNHFRQYASYGSGVYGSLDSVSLRIEQLRQLSLTNKDNAHRLERHYDEPKDDNIRFVEGDYPQNHSIQEAQRRIGEYPMDSLEEAPGF